MNTHPYSGFDIFSGSGGLSVGAEMAGINTTIAIENNNYSAQTYKFNHPSTNVIQEDITNVNPEKLVQQSPFVLFGGPPCQGFSYSNTVSRNKNNPNNSLFEQFIKFVKILNPIWFVFENVEGFETYEKGNVVRKLEEAFDKLGFTTNKKILCAADYGVPQKRNRFFIIGNRKSVVYNFPEKHTNLVQVGEAIDDLPYLKNGDSFHELPYRTEPLNSFSKLMRKNSAISLQNYVSKSKDYVIERYKYIKPGENWRSIPEELMRNYSQINNTHSGIYRRLDANKPSIVISNYRKNMLIHPSQDRGLSVREAARIQSFPDSFIFKGPLMSIQQQIGNAVPPLLAYEVFKSIINIEENERTKNCSQRAILAI